jgi:hypothetical protein
MTNEKQGEQKEALSNAFYYGLGVGLSLLSIIFGCIVYTTNHNPSNIVGAILFFIPLFWFRSKYKKMLQEIA